MNPQAAHAGAILTVDLDAIRSNYRLLRQQAGKASVAAAVKANAYGLGADQVGPALAAEGCRHFFVAHLDEGIALRPHQPATAEMHGPAVYVCENFTCHAPARNFDDLARLIT